MMPSATVLYTANDSFKATFWVDKKRDLDNLITENCAN